MNRDIGTSDIVDRDFGRVVSLCSKRGPSEWFSIVEDVYSVAARKWWCELSQQISVFLLVTSDGNGHVMRSGYHDVE